MKLHRVGDLHLFEQTLEILSVRPLSAADDHLKQPIHGEVVFRHPL
jgi:hypothetical protein